VELVGQSNFFKCDVSKCSYPPKALHFFYTLIYGRKQEKLFIVL